MIESREHRIPKHERSSFPTCWVLWYTWRRVVFFTPKVRLRALQITVSTLPRDSMLVGLWVGRDEGEEERRALVGLGFVEIEVNVLRFLSVAELAALRG